ncbi:hypothetical protein NPS29_00345 [Pseudomonas putida]|uniref:hypothetical protein n=1 Tax=Pseudomonas putida TaxID=303 RepID=UPI0023646321|nr:hypothetical protein [Pseudomonas putida]MDD1963760.1 hypothetical protein [Pseudomonas putida]
MIALLFVLVSAGWGLLLGSMLVIVLASAGRLINLLSPASEQQRRPLGYRLAVCISLVCLHFGYVSEDVIGRHSLASIGFYVGVATALALNPRQWRAILKKLG